jgi:hypothetical protein
VHSLIQFGVEELHSFHPGDCVTCIQLRRGLKEALMYTLLSSTWSFHFSQVTALNQLRNAEINLTYALKDFREHRRIVHEDSSPAAAWSADQRNAR